MIDYNCEACETLREDAPNFVVNGLGDTEVASLKNDTGLNSSSGNDDCEDLNNMNDCLVKNMQTEIDSYNVCSWKDYMKALVGNLWTMYKAIISAICGIWTNIHNLWSNLNALADKLAYVCDLLKISMNPTAPIYGIFPRTTDQDQIARTMGSIPTNNGRPALIDAQGDSHNNHLYTGVGLKWGEVTSVNCSTGETSVAHFWKPYVWGMRINKDVHKGDALWVVTKSQLQSMTGWSDTLWTAYTNESWTWKQHVIIGGDDSHKNIWLKLHVGDAGYSNNYLVLTFNGTSYPSENFDYDALIQEGDASEYRWGA